LEALEYGEQGEAVGLVEAERLMVCEAGIGVYAGGDGRAEDVVHDHGAEGVHAMVLPFGRIDGGLPFAASEGQDGDQEECGEMVSDG
jgi:hypothetical protein